MTDPESDRLNRIARSRVKARARNRASGIPDMEIGDRHEPAEWFAQVGFFAVLNQIGLSAPDHDWSNEGGSDADREAYLAARRKDHQRVADWLRRADVDPIANRHGATIGGIRVMWPDRVPALKVWDGRQTLATIAKSRQKALPPEVDDVLTCKAAIAGSSGLYKPCATTALEDGFSANALGMDRVTPVGLELLAIIGLETLPLTVHPDGAIEYDTGDGRFRFRVEDSGDYYGRWGTAERTAALFVVTWQ